jgi:uncharacterized protein (DUF1501 family)
MDVEGMRVNRREFIAACGSLTLVGSPLFNARAAGLTKRNLVVIMLRGGMDGLTAVQPRDNQMKKARPDIIVEGAKKLTSDFNLHPRLEAFHECWREGTAAVYHATSIPYTGRSHFDGQNLMETGAHIAYAEKTGWLGRGMDAAELDGLAVSLPMPLLLRGSTGLDNYFPTYMRMPSNSALESIQASYTPGSDLAHTLDRIRHRPAAMMVQHGDNEAHELAKVAADELSREDGPRIAVFDLDGFDTHAAQGGSDGEHGEQLNNYDRVLSVLKDNLGDAYDNTLIMTLTEFGRKVEQNGGYGTEHGYGTAILMAGGLVKKAEIHADWPGLRSKDMFEGQDLNATVDARSIYCAAMAACFDVDFKYMKKQAFWDEDLTDVTETLFRV